MSLKKSRTKRHGALTPEEEEAKVTLAVNEHLNNFYESFLIFLCGNCFGIQLIEFRSSLGPLSGRTALFCTDKCLYRYLKANNWSLKKSRKMLKETVIWRGKYTPEDIKWVYILKFCLKEISICHLYFLSFLLSLSFSDKKQSLICFKIS